MTEQTERMLANGLGWFSIGLGATQLLAPRWLGQKIGLGDETGLMRALGAREVLTGIGILAQDQPTVPMWGRVAGDAMDLAILGLALRSANGYSDQRRRLIGATVAVAGVGLLDFVTARGLQSSH